jgi:hypothetical protein
MPAAFRGLDRRIAKPTAYGGYGMARQKFLSLATMLLTVAVGCHGTIGDDTGEGAGGPGPKTGPGPGTGGTTGGGMTGAGARGGVTPPGGGTGGAGGGSVTPPPPQGDPLAAGPMPLRRLTRREYNNTIRDLLGDTANRADAFPADRDNFLFRRSGVVSSTDADSIKDAAEATANTTSSRLAMLAPCAAGQEDACARKFITDFGLRAYRRPLDTEEQNRLFALYMNGRSTLALNYVAAIQLLVEAMLQSPAFLYHWELGNLAPTVEGKVVKLNHYEVASRLSYLIWGSMPDVALFDAAKGNALGTAAEVQTQAKRMLADTKGRDTVAAFADEWLSLEDLATDRPKDPAIYPQWNDALKASMSAELRSFISSVVFDGDGKLTSLLTGTNSFVNQSLADIYGVKGVAGTDMKPAMLDQGQRAGLLTRAGWLAITGATNGSHPIKRGHKVYERLLCLTLPPPPNNVPMAKPPTEAGTTRQHVEEHSKNPCASACHSLMDPIGFAFEHYDGIGRFRAQDNGIAVDSSGVLELDGMKKPFNDARDFSQILASSSSVAQCFATQWLRYAFKRSDVEEDRASLESMDTAFAKNNSISDLLVGLVGTRSFRYRSPLAGEKLQ